MKNYSLKAFTAVKDFLAYKCGEFVGQWQGMMDYLNPQPFDPDKGNKSFEQAMKEKQSIQNRNAYERGYECGRSVFSPNGMH